MTWAELFERADGYDIDCQTVRERLAARRSDSQATAGGDSGD